MPVYFGPVFGMAMGFPPCGLGPGIMGEVIAIFGVYAPVDLLAISFSIMKPCQQ